MSDEAIQVDFIEASAGARQQQSIAADCQHETFDECIGACERSGGQAESDSAGRHARVIQAKVQPVRRACECKRWSNRDVDPSVADAEASRSRARDRRCEPIREARPAREQPEHRGAESEQLAARVCWQSPANKLSGGH